MVLLMYTVTKNFPSDEVFGLCSQMRRCAVSITSNIAEGFSRQSRKEKIQFFTIALGSITELQNQLFVARDVGYMKDDMFRRCADTSIRVQKLIHGLLKYLRSQPINT
ncbi:four helix bundle protein [Candidatus Uhrbacteria bacterium]|nr:four helix bundle protein [Candidatus Uhrbacteria bacterium]